MSLTLMWVIENMTRHPSFILTNKWTWKGSRIKI